MQVTLTKDKFKDVKMVGSKSQEELKELSKFEESMSNHDSIWLSFVLKNPKSYVAPYYLQKLEANQVISIDSLKSIFKGLDLTIQNSRYGRLIMGDIRKKENILKGAFASEFSSYGH